MTSAPIMGDFPRAARRPLIGDDCESGVDCGTGDVRTERERVTKTTLVIFMIMTESGNAEGHVGDMLTEPFVLAEYFSRY